MTLTILFRKMTILIFRGIITAEEYATDRLTIKVIGSILAEPVFFCPEKGTLGKSKMNILS